MVSRQESEQRFTGEELNSLLEVRARRALIPLPGASEPSFAERQGVRIWNQPAKSEGAPLYWRAHLRRSNDSGLACELSATFCTVPEWPSPPAADEVLQWLAMGVAHAIVISDQRGWAARYRINQSGRATTPCYRGVVRPADSLAEFETALARERRSLITFLGLTAFAELMESVGVDRALLRDDPREEPT